jgi:pantoate--beta-alanine ligase
MPHAPIIARTLPALNRALDRLRLRGSTIALVPTMGALHEGHISLVRLARRRAQKVAVSIFVNPTQFAPQEDLGSYPRTWKADIAKLVAEGVDLVWHPDQRVMYPDGFATRIAVDGPATVGLEDRIRPHFFGGVATVVAKLFTQVGPDVAIFGEKDFQQLMVVTRMARDLDLGVRIVGAPVIRERDGLAMSSRNVYLSASERATAPLLYQSLKAAAKRLRDGDKIASVLSDGIDVLSRAGFAVDYLEVRDTETLASITNVEKPLKSRGRLLVAAKIGTTRLIDNVSAISLVTAPPKSF